MGRCGSYRPVHGKPGRLARAGKRLARRARRMGKRAGRRAFRLARRTGRYGVRFLAVRLPVWGWLALALVAARLAG